MNVNDALHGISTLVTASTVSGQSQGTAFFYQQIGPPDPEKGKQWVKIVGTWIVTNRHVVLPRIGDTERLPDTFTFHLRMKEGERICWDPIVITQEELRARAKFHLDPAVDVAAVRVQDLLISRVSDKADKYLQWYALDSQHLLDEKTPVDVGDDALVIGYPRGFYDHVNLFPIVKSAIVASRWGHGFNGKAHFLVDAKLFPGSSGSVVITKPQSFRFHGNQLTLANEKRFSFLGVFSGEPYLQEKPLELEDLTITRKLGFNVGIVWYPQLVDQIIQNGVSYQPPANSR